MVTNRFLISKFELLINNFKRMHNPFLSLEEKLNLILKKLEEIELTHQETTGKLMNTDEFSKASGIPKPTIYAKVLEDKIPGAVKVGKRWVFDLNIYQEAIRKKIRNK